MTMRLKDVKPGMCWRFTSNTAPDKRNTYTLLDDEAGGQVPQPRLPEGWDDHYWEDEDSDDHSDFFTKNAGETVQLLMHYSKAPEGRPIEDYEAVPTSKVRPSQWYLGVWNESSAKAVAAALNRKELSTSSYRRGYGPISDPGWAIVRTMPEAVTASTQPVVRSCIDPLDALLTNLRIKMVHGVNGIECLWRYEYAQKNEQLCRTPGGFVSTHGDYGMNEAQVAHAQELWAVELRVLQRDTAAKAAARAPTVVCEDQHEL